MRIWAAQIDVHFNDLESNLLRVRRLLVDADRAGCDLLVFPELALSGYSLNQVPDRERRVSLHRKDPRLMSLTRGLSTGVVITFPERDGDAIYNTAAYYRRGRLEHFQRKVAIVDYLPFNEHESFDSGRQVEVFEIDGVKAAIAICNDAWVPHVWGRAVREGAELLIVPFNSALREGIPFSNLQSTWDVIGTYMAEPQQCAVVLANRVGREGEATFWGGSRILDADGTVVAAAPMGGPLKRGRGAVETVIEGQLDFDRLRQLRAARRRQAPNLAGAGSPASLPIAL